MRDIEDMRKIADFQEFVADFNRQETTNVSPKILKYLKESEVIAATGTRVIDEISNEETNIELLAYSDGEYLWDSRDIYYYETYGMPLNADFISKMV
jgi:hypothetical protein